MATVIISERISGAVLLKLAEHRRDIEPTRATTEFGQKIVILGVPQALLAVVERAEAEAYADRQAAKDFGGATS